MKTCPICECPIATEGTIGCFRRDTKPSIRKLAECYRRGYYRQKQRADALEAMFREPTRTVNPSTNPSTVAPSETRVKVVARIPPGVEFDLDMVKAIREKFPGPVAVRAANAVHDVASRRLGGQYHGVLTIAQIRDLPFGHLGDKTKAALQWLVGDLS